MAKHDDPFVFEWATCSDGYEFLSDETFRPLGEYWSVYDTAFEAPDIHQKLAALEPTEENFHAFVTEFGTLQDHSDEDASCSLDELKTLHNKVRSALDAWNVGDKESALMTLFLSSRSSFNLALELSPKGILEYKFLPINLASFIVFQLVKQLAQGLDYKTCEAPECGRRFPISEGSGAITKRQTKTKRAKFCSNACRQAANREKRKQAALNEKRKGQ